MNEILEWMGVLLPGLLVSLQLTAGLVAIGIPLGMVLALGLLSPSRILHLAALVVVEIARGIPALVLLYVVYFGLPQFNVVLDALPAAAIALGIGLGGFLADIFRAGLLAVPAGQREAAAALGLSGTTTFFRVILPQAARITTPPVLGYVISYFQATSLAFAVSVPELTSSAYQVASMNFRFLEVLSLAGVLYAAICITAQHLVDRRAGNDTSIIKVERN
ncbi:amino acid ABC transporter permease [Albidovulum sp.]|uniref:amino acid ABC transporter permease n=1 Tax=Albidovulum sp. TaxID=1872424 RepID=UPI0039B86A41